MFGLGFSEIIVILLIVLVIVGGKQLPQLGTGLGRMIANFRKGMDKDVVDIEPTDKTNKDA